MLEHIGNFFNRIFDHMPESASTFAPNVDWLNNFISYVAAFSTVVITVVMLYYAVRYRRRSENDKTEYITHSATLEFLWTAVPSAICLVVFYYGFIYYKDMREAPANAMEIIVEGYKWGWNYTYPNGKRASADLVVPVDTPVRLVMRSKDVNHSFFIPAMRIKEDVIAGTYHHQWFHATKEGDYHIFCTEYCGTSHSQMRGQLKVVSKEVYEDYVNDRQVEQLSPLALGQKLYKQQNCYTCHSLDGSQLVGPSFKGRFGTEVKFQDGTVGKVDEAYLRESIVNPMKKAAEGYPAGGMPAMYDKLTDEELDGLVTFIKSLN